MKPIVIFGIGKISEVAASYLLEHGAQELAAFTADREFIGPAPVEGLPVVPFDEVVSQYPPDRHDMFVAIGYQEMNDLRAARVEQVRKLGYGLTSIVHPRASVSKDAHIGQNCLVLPFASILPRTTIADNVFIWNSVVIGHHSFIDENTWIASGTNLMGTISVGRNCFIGATVTVGHDVQIGDRCFLGAATLITRNLPNGKVVVEKSSEVQRVSSDQFVRLIGFK